MGATHVVNHREDIVEQIKKLKLEVPVNYVYIVARTEQYTEAVAKIRASFGKVCTIIQADVSFYGTEFMSKSLTFSWIGWGLQRIIILGLKTTMRYWGQSSD
ncbi:hypothetical protein FSARC_9499 [Fusarium sarcochroum]|uniref:Uncharacterized protein n=1 Tax=Fusarium sarcochroum TaxID=1208366 RepID=A0A8H4TR63_9HYPO|nr:hypothetical protein FSARC_9499 [Fusarium sarcochroum]